MKTRYILQCGLIFIGTLVPTAIACHDVELGYIPGMNPVPVGSYAEYSLTQVASCSGNCTVFTYTWKVNGDVVDSGSNTSYGQTWSSTGTKTLSVTASCGGGGSATASHGIRVVGVASVSAGGVTSETDNPGASETVYVAKGSPGATIPVTAAPNPSGSWPSGRPTWNVSNPTAVPIDTAGTTTVTATCGTSSCAINIVVVEVGSIENDRDVECWNDPGGIIFTAIANPNAPLDYLQWEGRRKDDVNEPWSDWGTGTVVGYYLIPPNQVRFFANTTGYYQFRARNGSGQNTWAESTVVKVVKVDVEPLPHPPLEPGRICANAQVAFRKAPWKATVKPVGTTAKVSVAGSATVGEEPIEVSDGQIFYVHSIDEETTGSYTVTIAHDDSGDCPVIKVEKVFKFKLEYWRDSDLDNYGKTHPDLDSVEVNEPGGYINIPLTNEPPGAEIERSAYVRWGYQVKLIAIPDNSYASNVKTKITVDLYTEGRATLSNYSPPLFYEAPAISIGYQFLSVSIPLGGYGWPRSRYGSSLAGADCAIQIHDLEKRVLGTASCNWEQVGFPILLPRKSKEFDMSLSQREVDQNRTYSVGSPIHVFVEVAAGSNVGDFVYYAEILNVSPIVLENNQTISSVEIDNDGIYEIPIQ